LNLSARINQPCGCADKPAETVCFFSAGTVFFSHNKSANSIFQLAYQN